MELKATIYGVVPSKSNCYRIITIKGHGSLAKTPAMKAYEDLFYLQLPIRNANIKERFEFYINVFYPSDRSDLDNSLKVVLDCLQKAKVIENDRKCVKIVAQKFIDKEKPRVEIEIKPL